MAQQSSLNELKDRMMELAKAKGFGMTPKDVSVPEKIALIHSEVSEAYDAYRHKDIEHFAEELADIITRVMHLAGVYGIDLEKEIIKKIESNKNRTWDWDELNERHS